MISYNLIKYKIKIKCLYFSVGRIQSRQHSGMNDLNGTSDMMVMLTMQVMDLIGLMYHLYKIHQQYMAYKKGMIY